MSEFGIRRRQHLIDQESYVNTLRHYQNESTLYDGYLQEPEVRPGDHAQFMENRASDLWRTLQLKYTAGEDPAELATLLGRVVEEYQKYVDKKNAADDTHYIPPFLMSQFADVYVNYLHLVCTAILLHREDLIPIICGWNDGTDFDRADAVLEELFKFYLPDRPELDEWYWDQPYRLLLSVLDEEDTGKRPKLMKKYLKKWYASFKGQAYFWGQHEQITSEFSPYVGYWAMCAAAFTYLYDIDDSTYREEFVYPKDLVDYARSIPRQPVASESGETILRVLGGQTCPRDGNWFSPAKADSLKKFKAGDIMPSFDFSEYGTTIWQWAP